MGWWDDLMHSLRGDRTPDDPNKEARWGQEKFTNRRHQRISNSLEWDDTRKEIQETRNWMTGFGHYGQVFERGSGQEGAYSLGYTISGDIDQLYETFRTKEDAPLAALAVGGGEISAYGVKAGDRHDRNVFDVHHFAGHRDLFNKLMISEKIRRSAYKTSFFGV